MRRFLGILLLSGCLSVNILAAQMNTAHQAFIQKVLSAVTATNSSVRLQREKLKVTYQRWRQQRQLSDADRQWLKKIATTYRLADANVVDDQVWQELHKRVDVIPPSLALAQAIDESGWGTSRFAREANNYFGRWCFAKGCGLRPKKAQIKSHHEVKKFDSIQGSVRDYIRNLNSHPAYQHLREIRYAKRTTINGKLLAKGLDKYSARGQAYINDIQHLIDRFHLDHYDQVSG